MAFAKQLFFATAATALLCGVAAAQGSTLCTVPILPGASNNGGSPGGCVYFDVTLTSAQQINALTMNCDTVGAPVGITVYTNPLGFAGQETTGTWTVVATDDGTSISAGDDFPTLFTLAVPFTLPIGKTGIAIEANSATGSFGHEYTNGNGTNQFWTDGVMSIDLGSATNVPFTGTVFSPRVWNGCFHYGSGCSEQYNAGCAGTGGFVPDLNVAACVQENQNATIDLTKCLGGSLSVWLFGTGQSALPMGPMTSCTLNFTTLFPLSFAVPLGGSGGGNGSLSITALVPAGTAGATVNMQVFTQDPAGDLGFANSNGLEFTIQP